MTRLRESTVSKQPDLDRSAVQVDSGGAGGWRMRAIERGRYIVLALSGEIDVTVTGQVTDSFSAALAAARHGGRSGVIVDLAGLEFCDCSGITSFVEARKAAAAAGLPWVWSSARGRVAHVLTLAGMAQVLHMTGNLEDAACRLDGLLGDPAGVPDRSELRESGPIGR